MPSIKCGSFALNTVTGNQAVTGVGFAPKVVKFMVTARTADGTGNHLQFSYGMMTSSLKRCCSVFSKTAVATTVCRRNASTSQCIELIDDTGTIVSAQPVSMDSDGFTININTTPGTAYLVEYEAIGGSDLSVDLSTITLGTVTGSISKTGLGFQPDCIEAFACGSTSTSVTNGLTFSLGFYDGTNQACSGIGQKDAVGTTVANKTLVADKVIRCPYDDAEYQAVSATSMNSDGYTLNRVTVQATSTDIYVLAMKATAAGSFAVGTDIWKTSTGTKATTVAGMLVLGVALAGVHNNGSTIESAAIQLCLGLASGAGADVCADMTDRDNVATSRSRTAIHTGKVAQVRLASADTVLVEADLSAFASGSFTLDYTTVDTGQKFLFRAIGAANQTLTSGTATSQSSAVAPTVTPGASSQAPPAVSSQSSAVAPTRTATVTLVPGAASCASSTAAPTLTPGAATLAASAISSQSSAIAPTLIPGRATLVVPAASSATSAVAPTVTAVVSLVVGAATATCSVIAPTIRGVAIAIMSMILYIRRQWDGTASVTREAKTRHYITTEADFDVER